MAESVRIIETVTGRTMAEVCAARDAVRDADLVEIRLDGVIEPDVRQALAGRTRPVIVTCRAASEGGRFDGSEPERLRILAEAVQAGAEYVDVEWRSRWTNLPRAAGTTLVLSHHVFDEAVPADLTERVRTMRTVHDGPIKIAVTARSLRDCLTLRDAVREIPQCIAIGMGAAGQVTRVWPAGFGSIWTYGGTAAPGQLPVDQLVRRYRVRETSADTAIYGIAGQPLAHSASPAMHNAVFAAAGIDAVYIPFETCDADDALQAAGALGVRGLSVTAPLKTLIARRVGTSSEAAEAIGAVNTLRRSPRGWEAENFDADAFFAPLEKFADRLRNGRAVVLGAGGAARAAVWSLQRQGLGVAVSARRPEAAAMLAAEFGVEATRWPPSQAWTLIVNATPVGTWPDVEALPIPLTSLRAPFVYDLVYNPVRTALLTAASAAGAETIGGLSMLVHQARRQAEWWTGLELPHDVFESAARECVVTGPDDRLGGARPHPGISA